MKLRIHCFWASEHMHSFLQLAFGLSLLFRGYYVLLFNPINNIFSDPERWWSHTETFFHPRLFGSSDPIMYQAYLTAIRFLSMDNIWAIGLFTSILSALLPWFWYKALQELVSKNWALAGATAIALMPSLIMIYSYFMNETLLLTLMAASIWLTLRAWRLGSLTSYAWAALVWALASYTRMTALPMAAICLAVLCLGKPWQRILNRATLTVILFGAMLIPACWHSQVRLNFCAPFGFTAYNAIHNAAQTANIDFSVVENGGYHFGQCAINNQPFAPFSTWQPKATGSFHFTIDPAHGRTDWNVALEEAHAYPGKTYTPWKMWFVNLIKLFLDPSWPDNNNAIWMGWLAIQSRWLILPLFIELIGLTMQCRRAPWRVLLVPALGLILMGMLGMQQQFTVEGRYRKPAEPLLIAGVVILLYHRRYKATCNGTLSSHSTQVPTPAA